VAIKHIRIVTKQAWSIKNYRYVWDVSSVRRRMQHCLTLTIRKLTSDVAVSRWGHWICPNSGSDRCPWPCLWILDVQGDWRGICWRAGEVGTMISEPGCPPIYLLVVDVPMSPFLLGSHAHTGTTNRALLAMVMSKIWSLHRWTCWRSAPWSSTLWIDGPSLG
jgi:hypothetical protein